MIKKLLQSVRQYTKDSILSAVFILGEVVMEVIIPLLMAKLIDEGIDVGDMGMILEIGAVLLACAMISLFFGIMAGKKAAIASSGVAKNLRHDMYENVQSFSFSNIDKFSTGSIITRLTTDVSNVQMAYQTMIRMGMRAPVMMLFALIAAISIDARLSLIFLAIIPFLAVGLAFIISRAHPLFTRVFKTYDKLNNDVQENLRGIRVVKSFVREEHEVGKFNQISRQIFEDFSKAEKTIAFNAPLMQISVYACMLLLSWFGARAVVASGNNPVIGLSAGELMSLFTYTMQILMSLMMLSMIFVIIVISRASAERIYALLIEESDLRNPENPVREVKNGEIKFEDVNFYYSRNAEKLCLESINLTIHSGETVGILGTTGSAKTSLVQLIPRLYDVTAGRLLVGGVDVRDYDLETLRNQVAMVLQKNELFSGTINENLRWGNEHASDEEIRHACQIAQADAFIMNFPNGYETHIEQGGTNISGGQKQRLCIARALLKTPKVLILDDSTSAVDTKTDSLIIQAFKREIPDVTKLIIAQRVSSVKDADKIVLLNNGRIDAVGIHSELLRTNAIYKEVYESQSKGSRLHG
jgi:ATP-binding cassette subfamily B protein